ncbi:MAG: hypothetical protein MJ190_00035 [Bacilli bacterium]|nr:hypothetical protein [Bacilli bacterium]
MKKNDLMGYVVYIIMLGVAVWVGLSFIRPVIMDSESMSGLPMPGLVLVLLSVLIGVIITALVLELGHLLGAKLGKYKITSWTVLGIQFKRQPDGKFKPGFGNFDGITGETKVVPLDVKTSNPRHIIYMPLALFLLEVIACVVLMVVGKNSSANGMIGVYVFGLVVLTVGLLIFLYDIFPAALDSKNDGSMLSIFSNQTNIEAYNEILIASEMMAKGEKVENVRVYESVTDFTSQINDVAIYKALLEENYEEALRINEFTIKCKDHVSSRVYLTAVAQKMALHLFLKPTAEAKEEYLSLKHEEKKFIANLENAPAVRAYMLVCGLVEDSEIEIKVAMDKAESAIKTSGEDKRQAEEALMKAGLKKVMERHPKWDFSEYSGLVEAKKEEAQEEQKAE